MTVPLWVLLAFAGWTLLTLITGVGIHRWSHILTGRAKPVDYRADFPHGPERYRYAMRAHANCIENLPVYASIVLAMVATGVIAPVLDQLALVFIAARVAQTTVHIVPPGTNTWVLIRAMLFIVQLVCMAWMGIYVALRAA
ncbi:MAG: MAPEG family protein [Myxococcota bacterium]